MESIYLRFAVFFVLSLHPMSNSYLSLIRELLNTFSCLVALLLAIKMGGSAMDIPLLRVNELQWKISLRQGYLKLMVRWLHFLVYLMVRCYSFLKIIQIRYLKISLLRFSFTSNLLFCAYDEMD